MIDSPSDGASAKAPRWDLTGTEGCSGGNRVSWCSWMFSRYVDIYRQRKSVRGAMLCLELALVFLEEERVMQQSATS